jgi:hypothetical protein
MLVASVIGSACGGTGRGTVDSAAPQTTQPADDGAAVSTTTPETTPGNVDDSPPESGSANRGVVSIGGTDFVFDATPDVITECDPDFFGAFRVVGVTEAGDTVEILLPPPDDANFEGPPSVRVKVNNGGADWTADPSILETGDYASVISEGDSQVDSFTVEGNSASGTATFVDEQQIFAALGGTGDPPEPVQGTFEVTCAPR